MRQGFLLRGGSPQTLQFKMFNISAHVVILEEHPDLFDDPFVELVNWVDLFDELLDTFYTYKRSHNWSYEIICIVLHKRERAYIKTTQLVIRAPMYFPAQTEKLLFPFSTHSRTEAKSVSRQHDPLAAGCLKAPCSNLARTPSVLWFRRRFCRGLPLIFFFNSRLSKIRRVRSILPLILP